MKRRYFKKKARRTRKHFDKMYGRIRYDNIMIPLLKRTYYNIVPDEVEGYQLTKIPEWCEHCIPEPKEGELVNEGDLPIREQIKRLSMMGKISLFILSIILYFGTIMIFLLAFKGGIYLVHSYNTSSEQTEQVIEEEKPRFKYNKNVIEETCFEMKFKKEINFFSVCMNVYIGFEKALCLNDCIWYYENSEDSRDLCNELCYLQW